MAHRNPTGHLSWSVAPIALLRYTVKMETCIFTYKSQKATLRVRRPLLVRLLFTCFYTAVFLIVGLYGFNKWMKNVQTDGASWESQALPNLKPLVYTPLATPESASGSFTFVKKEKSPIEDWQERPRSSARAVTAKPHLRPVPFGWTSARYSAMRTFLTPKPVLIYPPAAKQGAAPRSVTFVKSPVKDWLPPPLLPHSHCYGWTTPWAHSLWRLRRQ